MSTLSLPPRCPVVGTPISLTTYPELLEVVGRPPADKALCVAFCNVHAVMTARKEPQVAEALRSCQITAPDGMPLVWALRRFAEVRQERVYGPDFMELALREGVVRGWRHYFYGTTQDTLEMLDEAAKRLAPGVQIVGHYAPPFGPFDDAEDAHATEQIRAAEPDLVWVGLGMPKQELWIARMRKRLPGKVLLGVGAAFDLLSGRVAMAPDWVQDSGLEWAYRLWREPNRLWRRYLFTNPAYLLTVGRDRFAAHIRGRARGLKVNGF